MKIAIDLTCCEHNPAGVGQFTINLVNSLLKLDSKNEYFIYRSTEEKILDFEFDQKLSEKIHLVRIKRTSLLPMKGVIWMLSASKDMKKIGIDLLISPSNFLFSKLFNKTIQFVYDLSPIVYPKYFPWKSALFYKYSVKFMLPKALKIITISEKIKKDLCEYLKLDKEKVEVIYPSINLKMLDSSIDFVHLDLPSKYLLCISTLQPRKNIINLIEGFSEYISKYSDSETKLVIVGQKGWFFNEIFEKVKKLNLQNRIVFLGYVEDSFMKNIIESSAASAYLSEYEGFGMPPLESLYFNKPVVLSDIEVFRECFSKNAIFVNPKDNIDIAKGIDLALNGKVKIKFDKEEFTWEKSALKLVSLY